MNLVERLEKLATQFDRQRWSPFGLYNTESADYCDILREAAKELKKHERTH